MVSIAVSPLLLRPAVVLVGLVSLTAVVQIGFVVADLSFVIQSQSGLGRVTSRVTQPTCIPSSLYNILIKYHWLIRGNNRC